MSRREAARIQFRCFRCRSATPVQLAPEQPPSLSWLGRLSAWLFGGVKKERPAGGRALVPCPYCDAWNAVRLPAGWEVEGARGIV